MGSVERTLILCAVGRFMSGVEPQKARGRAFSPDELQNFAANSDSVPQELVEWWTVADNLSAPRRSETR
jgi:hypothetical protein